MISFRIKQFVSVIIIIFCLHTNVSSQNTGDVLGKVNIASPNASALGKYGDIPVSYHTGIPNIGIPLYTLKFGSLQLPVSLSYHASGLKVEENDSWVGAGWSLIAGGAITRTVKSKPDEKQTNSLQQTYGYFSDYGIASIYPQNGVLLQELNFDSEPDLFSFNFNGYSGKFYFNDDRTPIFVPEQDFKVEYSYTPGQWNGSPGAWAGLGRCIESFTITTPDGTKYYFGMNGAVAPYCDPIEVSSTYTSMGGTSYAQVISSWYLNKIVSADGNFSINLNYERDKYAFYSSSNSPTATMDVGNPVNYKYQLVKTLMAGVRLSKITGVNEKIDFTPGAVRLDLSNWSSGLDEGLTDYINQSSPTLGSLSISDIQGNCYKKFNFYYNYFTDNVSTVHANFSGIVSDKKRLRLDSLKEQSCAGTVLIPAYKFDYFQEQVPRKLKFSKDHWGYNNGISTNTQLYPKLSITSGVINPTDFANRESAWPAMRAGSLNKITYPTGGSTTFDFEPNRVSANFTINSQLVAVDTMVGGLRIKNITNYIPETNQSVVTSYTYQSQGSSVSSGVLYSKPTYIQIFRNDWMKKTNFLANANGNGCWDNLDADTVTTRAYVYSDNPIRPMETTQGFHIGYGEVKVSQTGNGFTIYRFSVTPPWLIDRNGIATTSISDLCSCDPTIPNYPAAPLAEDFHRGEKTYEGRFNETGNVLSETLFQTLYDLNPVTIPGRLTFSFSTSAPFTVETYYELKTAHKTQSTVIERVYQPGVVSPVEKQTQTFFESNFHHEPTRTLTYNSKSQAIESKTKYAFDYRVPSFDNTTNCYVGAAGFMDYANSTYASGNYQAQFNACAGYTASCHGPIKLSYFGGLFAARKSYIDCRKTNYTNTIPLNSFQTNHNTARAAANTELKPVLWMQDNYMNLPVETSVWKSSQLLNASYTKYSNNRDDAYGVYPDKTLRVDLPSAASTFTASTVAADNISITKDSRYKDATLLDFNRGNVISAMGRDGIAAAYQWGYNEAFPVVKAVNTTNKLKESIASGAVTNTWSFQIGSSSNSGQLNVTFTQTQTGNITISLPFSPPGSTTANGGATANATYTLTGPSTSYNRNGYLCYAGNNGPTCSGTPSTITFTGMIAGQYTLVASVSTGFTSYSFNYSLNYTYQGMVISSSGLKEFFYEGFEESTDVNAVTAFAHTGKKYLNAHYTNTFVIPNSRSYTIQWWDYTTSVWKLNTQPYVNGMLLIGPVDDIRIFPKDAQLNTYTYDAIYGMTSQTDPNGKTTYYDYDSIGHLKNIKDNNRYITKNFFYNYGASPSALPTIPAPMPPNPPPPAPPPTTVNFSANNSENAIGFDIKLTNKTTGLVYNYTIAAGVSAVLGAVPPGTYDVYAIRKSSTTIYGFQLCTFSAWGASITFYNVSISTTACNNIYFAGP